MTCLCVSVLLVCSCRSQCASASWAPGPHMLLWPCGLLSEMPRESLLQPSPWPPCSPNPPPSTTLWSTCCANPTSASASTETRPRYDRGSTREAPSHVWGNVWDRTHSTIRTTRASPTDSRRTTGRVCTALGTQRGATWHRPKEPPASWLDPPAERWQSASSQQNHRRTSYRMKRNKRCSNRQQHNNMHNFNYVCVTKTLQQDNTYQDFQRGSSVAPLLWNARDSHEFILCSHLQRSFATENG